ncbi:hypothetical protein SDC9_140240 [bioreactor metagenome]|uniref:Uncharacterized protein n=1 Tax=bioreactor metagenome TaxID=1076179 RepID=A0A645DUA4_9ZZZZ
MPGSPGYSWPSRAAVSRACATSGSSIATGSSAVPGPSAISAGDVEAAGAALVSAATSAGSPSASRVRMIATRSTALSASRSARRAAAGPPRARRISALRRGSRNPYRASNGSRATMISGLGQSSLYVRVGSPRAIPASFSSWNPARACSAVGCTCRDNARAALSSFIRKGSRSPNSAREHSPSTDGSAAITSSSPMPSTVAGPAGCAPSQYSAKGFAVGASPRSVGMRSDVPQA